MAEEKISFHKVTISGPIINFSIEVSGVVAAQVYQGLAKLTSKVSESSNDAPSATDQIGTLLGTVVSPREYLTEVHAKTNPEKILAFTKFLSNSGLESVGVGEIKLQFQKALEPIPANFSRDFDIVIRNRWIALGADGRYYVTNIGSTMLESEFSTGNKTSTKKVKGVRKTRFFVETPLRKEVEQMSIDPNLIDFPDYHDLSKRADKILWLLVKAKSCGLDKLNQKEVTFLSEKIGDYIPRKSISALVIPAKSDSLLYSPNEGGITYLKILEKGEIYLKTLNK